MFFWLFLSVLVDQSRASSRTERHYDRSPGIGPRALERSPVAVAPMTSQDSLDRFTYAIYKCHNFLNDQCRYLLDSQHIINLQEQLNVATQGLDSGENIDHDKVKFAAAATLQVLQTTGSSFRLKAPIEQLRRISVSLADGYQISASRSASPSSSSDETE